jgi:hypothetical protein
MFGEDELGPKFSEREETSHILPSKAKESSSKKERVSSVISYERPRHN